MNWVVIWKYDDTMECQWVRGKTPQEALDEARFQLGDTGRDALCIAIFKKYDPRNHVMEAE